MRSNFIVPFDQTTRQTTLPELDEGETLDMWHLTREQGGSVVVQIRGTDARIAAMKADPVYCWLEDIPEVEDAII